MSLLILGADTDAGKTSFALLWLAAFPSQYTYWKPVETGESDTGKVRLLVPEAKLFDPLASFGEAVAPPLAARRGGKTIPSARQIAQCASSYKDQLLGNVEPESTAAAATLLIETFGGPLSPLNENELQIELIRQLDAVSILVSSSAIGAVGRTLSVLRALETYAVRPAMVVLMGKPDDYAREQIAKYAQLPVSQLQMPETWDVEGVRASTQRQLKALQLIRDVYLSPGTIVHGANLRFVRGHVSVDLKKPLAQDVISESSITGQLAADATAAEWGADRTCIWHPYTALRGADAPLRVVGAQDEFLHLADGRRIVDGISSWWTILHGHRDPRLMSALQEASHAFDHVLFAGATHLPAIRVARLLLNSMPWNGGRVFFSDNGSTAVEVALKMAYQYWCHRGEAQRTLFVGFEDGYHGDTFGAMAVGRDPLFFGRFEPLLFQTQRIPVSAERLDEVLQQNGGRAAGVILEPLVQGAGGMRMHSPEQLRAIFDVVRKHQTLFIADEVMTGCYRTGTMWAYQAAGIAPDLVCAAKTLAGGILSLAATIASPEIVSAFDTADRERTFFHGHSFTAHPLACAIAAANLQLLASQPPEAPARMEAFWTEALASLRECRHVREVRIRGTIAAIEIDVPGGYLAETARGMRLHCLERGVFLRPLGNVLYAMPPLATSDESLVKIAEAMREAVAAVAADGR